MADKKAKAKKEASPDSKGNVVYTMCFRHWKTGKIVRRADGRPFRFET